MADLPSIQTALKKINKLKSNYVRACKRIGTKQDSEETRTQLNMFETDFNTQKADIQSLLQQLQASKNIVLKLQSDVKSLVAEFDAAQKQRVVSQRRNPLRRKTTHVANPFAEANDGEQQQQKQQQQQQQHQQHQQHQQQKPRAVELIVANRLQVERAIALEQHQSVQEIAREVRQLNDLTKDVAILVEDQGEALDNIAENIGSAGEKVERGVVELHKANAYQQKNRKLLCCCLIMGLVIAVCILIPTLLATEKDNNPK
jgi:hypothetical protein